MKKSVVVLADTDETIIAPLEIKFLEGMGDDIDLRVITDIEYFNNYFSQPQDADVLVISEELYSPNLLKQNFRNTFVLSERKTGDLSELGVKEIFKYASLKEIYSRIITEGGLERRDKARSTQVVMVYSASGGTGKTTLSLAISAYFAHHYQRTLYISAERTNCFQHKLKDKTYVPSGMYPDLADNKGDFYKLVKPILRNETFDYMPPFAKAISTIGIDFSIYKRIISGAKDSNDYDVIIIDTDHVFDRDKAELAAVADKILILSMENDSSVFSTNALTKNMNCSDEEKHYFIYNNCGKENGTEADKRLSCRPEFTVCERIATIEGIDRMELEALAEHEQIKKIAALIL